MATLTDSPLTHKPDLQLSLASPADARAISDVWYACFPEPFVRKMFPHTPAVQQWWDDANTADMLQRPAAQYVKVTDAAANQGRGRIVGYAKWFVPVGSEKPELERRFPAWAAESDAELCDRFFGHLVLERRRLLGDRQHYYLCMLGTIPEYRRLGVASMLVGWGCERADRAGLEAFVDASDQGKPVYAKFGFEPEEPFLIPGEDFACTSYLRKARK